MMISQRFAWFIIVVFNQLPYSNPYLYLKYPKENEVVKYYEYLPILLHLDYNFSSSLSSDALICLEIAIESSYCIAIPKTYDRFGDYNVFDNLSVKGLHSGNHSISLWIHLHDKPILETKVTRLFTMLTPTIKFIYPLNNSKVLPDDMQLAVNISSFDVPDDGSYCVSLLSSHLKTEIHCFSDLFNISIGGLIPNTLQEIRIFLQHHLTKEEIGIGETITVQVDEYYLPTLNSIPSITSTIQENNISTDLCFKEYPFKEDIKVIASNLQLKKIILNLCDVNLLHELKRWFNRISYFGYKENIIVIAIDLTTAEYCKKEGIPFITWEGESPKEIGYDRIKYFGLISFLELNIDVLFSEMDVYWFQDPFLYLFGRDDLQDVNYPCHWCYKMGGKQPPFIASQHADLLISSHSCHSRVNIGFFYMRSNERTIRFIHLLLTLKTKGIFDQSIFDALLENVDVPIEGDVCKFPKNIPNLRWRKLDYNVFAGGDGVDFYENLVTLHCFHPMKKSILDDLYENRFKMNQIPLLDSPKQFYHYIYQYPGVYLLSYHHETYFSTTSTISLTIQVNQVIPLDSDFLICFKDHMQKTENCIPSNMIKLRENVKSDAIHLEEIQEDDYGAIQWTQGTILRGAGNRIAIMEVFLQGFTLGKHILHLWLQNNGTPINQPLVFRFTIVDNN